MIKPGERSPLNVTKEAKHRVFVGLGWDPHEKPSLGETIGALVGVREKHHDLDLSCFYYDAQKTPMGVVTAEPEHYSNASGRIYHSGDNVEGVGEGDDEQISVELKDLPDSIHHLVFKASIKSGHNFNDIRDPEIRLCDGYTERCFLETPLCSDQDAYVFARIFRADNDWQMVFIDEFIVNSTLNDLKNTLKAYLD